ncbi:MAG: glycosyltransferase family 4 protein [Acidobacteriota bacterium]|nr:glycosyltransferase family 4 protein [Acidobacteriota bacterium]
MSEEKQNSTPELPRKIIFIWNYLEWGGAQVYLFGLMKEAQKFCQVAALLPSGSDRQLLEYLNNIKVPYKFFDAHTDLQPATTLKRKLERHWNKVLCEIIIYKRLKKIDLTKSVVHLDFPPWQSLTFLWWLSLKTKVFVTIHNAMPEVPKWRQLLWRAKFGVLARTKNFNIFTSNENARDSLRQYVSGNFLEKITVTSTNVNPDEIDRALQFDLKKIDICRKYDLPEDKFMVFCVGQFIDRKGRWVFLEAARSLIEKNKDIHFVWISNSKLNRDELKKIESYKLDRNFTLVDSEKTGGEHVDLFKLLRIADVFTLPSYIEGLPISLLEAMALGIPSVSTDVNAIPEAVKHLETGLLIETGDAGGLVNAIEKLKSDRNLRKSLSENGRDFVLRNFNEAIVAKIAFAAYKKSFSATQNK